MTIVGKSLVTVSPETGRISRRTARGYESHLAWCATHLEPVWVYTDDSWSCPYDASVGYVCDHEVVKAPWETA